MSSVFCLVADVEGILTSCGFRGYSVYLGMSRVFCLVVDIERILSSCGCRGYSV